MKQFLAIPLIFIMMVKPLWPVAEYIINYDYIVINLCENRDQPQLQCDGKCYLSKLLAEENGNQEDNPFENHQQYNEVITLPYFSSQHKLIGLAPIETQNKNKWSYFDQRITPPFLNQPTPPPKTVV